VKHQVHFSEGRKPGKYMQLNNELLSREGGLFFVYGTLGKQAQKDVLSFVESLLWS
jgi:hypothetical protein